MGLFLPFHQRDVFISVCKRLIQLACGHFSFSMRGSFLTAVGLTERVLTEAEQLAWYYLNITKSTEQNFRSSGFHLERNPM